jgi:hypothetical protein
MEADMEIDNNQEVVVDAIKQDLIDTFCAITNASSHVAEHYLSAHGFDLNQSVAFYLEHPPGPADGPSHADAAGPRRPNQVVDLSGEDGDDDIQRALAESMMESQDGAGPQVHRPLTCS